MKKTRFSLAVLVALGGCALEPDDAPDEEGAEIGTDSVEAPPRARSALRFEHACDPGETFTLAAVGDVLLHTPLQRQAYTHRTGAKSLWEPVQDLLARADLIYANLEGPTASGVTASGRSVTDPGRTFDGVVYSSYPQFNYHASLVADLVASGFDVVSTANNHSLDRRALGIDRTLDALDLGGLPHTGTRRQGDTTSPWHTVTESRGLRVAWLACTEATNGIPDSRHQVLSCISQATEMERIVRDLAGDSTIDAVVVTPHWGSEYTYTPGAAQRSLAHRLLEAGALVVLGSHPHVLQPWERFVTRDGRETFVVYSLGNFVSGQTVMPRQTTILLYLGLTRGTDGQVRLNGARYVPMYMAHNSVRWAVQATDRASTSATTTSRTLSTTIFGSWNLLSPDEALVTNPECP